MLDAKTMKAVGQMLARTARKTAEDESTAKNDVIDLMPLLKQWAPGDHVLGTVVVENGAPYKVIQAHDSTNNPDWMPSTTPALFAPFHGTDKDHALPYAAPTHAGDAYMAGEWMIYTDGLTYMCKQDHTVHAPDVLPSAWEVYVTQEEVDEERGMTHDQLDGTTEE